MTDDRFREIWVEILEMSERLDILDPSNPIERDEAMSISNRLQELLAEAEEGEKQERLSRFQLIKNEEME